MKTFKIQIKETLLKTIDIQAENVEDAVSIVNKMYKAEEIVLDYNSHVDTQTNALIDFCATKQLIERLMEISPKMLECNLQINELNATHYIHVKEMKVFDETIDGTLIEWDVDSFVDNYASFRWIVNYID